MKRRRTEPAKAAPRPRPATAFPGGAPGFVLLLVLATTIALHAKSLGAAFFGDDYWFLDHVRGRSFWGAITSPAPIGPFIRPWSDRASWWLVARLFGESPVAFHAVNLALLLAVVVLVFVIARRLFDARAAVVAAAILGIHYAPEAAVRWASGSQDLWAVSAALACIALQLHGRTILAAFALLLALLSKETALVTPLVVLLLDRRDGEEWWRPLARARWLLAAFVGWAAIWIPNFAASLRQSHGYLSAGPVGLPAALLHFLQTIFGLEGPLATPIRPELIPPGVVLLALVTLVATVLVARRSTAATAAARARPPGRGTLGAVAAWALLAAVPVAAVAPVWSAYQYLFALCAIAVGLGAVLVRRSTPLLVSALLVLAVGSYRGWGISAFASQVDPWKPLSRVNGAYLRRAESQASGYLQELKRVRPTLPPRSTLFFAGLPAFVGWQSGDGATLRWAYRDTSLKSYFLSGLTLERARRGTPFFFTAAGGRMQEITGPTRYRQVAGGLILSDELPAAGAAFALGLEEAPEDPISRYFHAWYALAVGDSATARRLLAAGGFVAAPGPLPELPEVERMIDRGDSARALSMLIDATERREFDAAGHGRLADLLERHPQGETGHVIESLAAKTLAPNDWTAWRRWGLLQARTNRTLQAARSLARARALRGDLPPDPVIEDAIVKLHVPAQATSTP